VDLGSVIRDPWEPSFIYQIRILACFAVLCHLHTHSNSLPQVPIDQTHLTIMSQAFVQKPAPAFKATTVFPGGEFKDISLSDFLGQW
jgi:hypothetical protein